MKKHNWIYVTLLVALMLNIGGFVFLIFREVPQPQFRITNILDEHGDRLKSIAAPNITTVGGAVTVLVDTLQSPIQFENYSGHIRWNITSSRLEYSDDDSATWLDMITATDITYENLSANGDVGTASNQIARGSHLHDDRYYTETEIDGAIASINSDLGDLFDEFELDIGHAHTGAAEDGRKITHSNISGLHVDDHTQYLLADGSRELSSDWDAGSHKITAETLESDVADGTSPLMINSTTIVANLNVDLLDNQEGTYYQNYSNLTNRPADDNFNNLTTEIPADDADKIVIYDNVSSLYRKQTRANFLTNRLQVIATDTTYYISTTGNDTTGDGSSGTPWATPQKALSYLADYWIPDDVTVTIELADGTYALASQIDIEHPCGARISIVGENTHAKSLTSIQSSSGSAGDYSIILNLNSVADIAVNDYVLIKNAANGTAPTYVMGCHKVTNVDSGNTRITVNSKHKIGVPSGAVTADITVVKTMLSFASSNAIVADKANVLGNLNKVVLVGSGGGYNGLIAQYGSSIHCGVSVGSVTWYAGFLVQFSGSIYVSSTVASGNTIGFRSTYSSFISADDAIASGNGTGFHSTQSASFNSESAIATGNTTGFSCKYSAEMRSAGSTATGNTTGYKAERYGYMFANGYTVSGNSTDFSPVVNTQGNEYGYIDT